MGRKNSRENALSHAILRVAVPVPVHDSFDYLWPQSAPPPPVGCRVRVPFGRQEKIGVVLAHPQEPARADLKLRAISAVLDTQPVLDQELLDLLVWCAQYYHHPIGEVLIHALPAKLRQGRAADHQDVQVVLSEAGRIENIETIARRAPKQAEILRLLQDSGRASKTALTALGVSPDALKRLGEKGLVNFETVSTTPDLVGKSVTADAIAVERPSTDAKRPTLTADQQQAIASIRAQSDRFGTHLLFGVTGSGKTEVFLRLIEQCLEQGQQTLLLVPEISLTPQLVGRLAARFGTTLAVLHSGLTDGSRLNAWRAARNGAARLIVGTRSAVFCPLPNAGLIIVDEEHDPSLKQQTGFRYSARDLAVYRGRTLDVPVVLASATPSLETFRNARDGRYSDVRLPSRIGSAGTPAMHVIDMRHHASRNGLSTPLGAHLERHLARGNQVLLFLNRRGFAPALYCPECEAVADCRRCDAHLTVHARVAKIRCHHCGHEEVLKWACPTCGQERVALGEGTQRITNELATLFPDQNIARLDRDALTTRESLGDILRDVASGETGIIVGTQLLAKGHDFPGVTLVAILNADQGLFGTDFRAEERLAQTILQVAGRAGRRDKPGEVIIQTHFPQHPLLVSLLDHDYAAFADAALRERSAAGWPPFTHLAAWRAEASHKQPAVDFLRHLRQEAEAYAVSNALPVLVLGPSPNTLERVGGRYRFQLLFQCEQRAPLHALIEFCLAAITTWPQARRVRWAIDVDPLEL